MSKITLVQPTSGYALSVINDNFVKLMAEFQDKVLYRNNTSGEANAMQNDLDMNGKDILNVGNLTVGGVNVSSLNSALIWRGTWSGATAYAKSDAVYYNGSSYIAVVANTNSTPPSANWNVLAAQGGSGAGTGDVIGPASSTTNNIAVYASGTGKLIKDSGITVAMGGPVEQFLESAIASDARSAIGAAVAGSNTDITDLSALTTVPTVIASAIAAVPSGAPYVRQTVLNGPVDSNGFSSFGGSTGSTTVTATGTLVATASSGNLDRSGSIVNPSWTSLSTNGTMYLYLDIASNGTCTTGSTTLAPTYRWGGTDVVTSGQNTFNIQEMQMKVGNGSTASQVWRVFVGEVAVSGSVVTVITWYALLGRYTGAWVATLPAAATAISVNHNIGTVDINPKLELQCTSAEFGYAIGDTVTEVNGNTGGVAAPISIVRTYKTVGFTVTNSGSMLVLNKTTGANATMTLASWRYRLVAQREW